MEVVQYIILRRDLIDKFGIGFAATQTAHASLAPLTSQLRNNYHKSLLEILDSDTLKWIEGTFKKIVLAANNIHQLKQISESLNQDNIKYCEIRESNIGFEITGIGLRPYERSKVSHYFKGLGLLR